MRIFRLSTCLKLSLILFVIFLIYFLATMTKSSTDFPPETEKSKFSKIRDGSDIHRIFLARPDDPEEIEPEKLPLPVFNKVSFKQTSKNLQHKIVHLDLKGAPPKIEYLISLLPELKKAGATGILLEYEDMFPYDGELENIKAKNAYGRQDLLDFLRAAQVLDLDVIPLIQTFGHLQYVLKLKEYRHLRETDNHPDSLCPSRLESIGVVKDMLRQIYELHNEIHSLKWLHIGCDEVYHLNMCDTCLKRNISHRQIFINHVITVASFVKVLNPNIIPLIWDDMLRSFPATELLNSSLKGLIQPVVWIYGETITSLVQHRIWYTYAKTFDKIWIASAFKGASGATQVLPDLQKHYRNHLAWLDFATNYKIAGDKEELYNFEGIFLTGWSRYDHFSVLCEMLPPSMPSLYLNLLLVNTYLNRAQKDLNQNEIDDVVFRAWWKMLKCPERTDLRVKSSPKKSYSYLTKFEEYLRYCNFDAGKLYDDFRNLIVIESEIQHFLVVTSFKTNGLLQYNLDHGIYDVEHLSEMIQKAKRLEIAVGELSRLIYKHLSEFFDEHTADELIEYKILPLKQVVNKVLKIADGNGPKIWDTRPFIHKRH